MKRNRRRRYMTVASALVLFFSSGRSIGSDPLQIRHRERTRLRCSWLHNLLHAYLVDRESLFLLGMVRDGEGDPATFPRSSMMITDGTTKLT